MNKYRKKTIPLPLKALVWNKIIGEEKGIGNCYCCKTKIRQISFHCGHVISEKNGGPTSIDNLVPLCQMCNCSIGSQNINDFMKKYNINCCLTDKNNKNNNNNQINIYIHIKNLIVNNFYKK